ncbi:outer membrane protein assembly factor BamB family protein [Phaeocystidibacter marisrubri]|nr:PQQ-binding-like beta-propeller repeat protein [Phaeocystidibacter marisrubri]GGH65191.1 hypothetical protein GCM10011318_01950 [Phaeocystidibacter marisrubri]
MSSINPVMYKDVVVFSSDRVVNTVRSPVVFLDTATGEIRDYWTDFSDGPFTYLDESMAHEGQYLFLSGQRSVDCINMETHQTQWHGPAGDNSPLIYVSDGFLYRGFEYDGMNPTNNSAAIMRTPVDSRDWDTVYAFTRTDRYKPGFDSMGFGTLTNGDEVVVWKNRSITGSSDRTDIFAYNLTADTLLWRNMDFVEGSGVIPLKVERGVVYGLLRNHAVALDLATGNTIWSQDFNSVKASFPLQFYEGDFYINGNTMLIKGPAHEIMGLSIEDGSISWLRKDLDFGIEDRFTYFEGKLFFTTTELAVIDVHTGERVLESSRVEHLGNLEGRVTIDPIRRVMYMNNGLEALCVKIPDDI